MTEDAMTFQIVAFFTGVAMIVLSAFVHHDPLSVAGLLIILGIGFYEFARFVSEL